MLTVILAANSLVLVIALALDGRNRSHDSAASQRAAGLREPSRATEALSFRFPQIDFEGVPLIQALETLATRAHAEIDVDWRSLISTGVRPVSPVTLHLRNASFVRALDAVLDASKWTRTVPEYRIVDGVFVVTCDPTELRYDDYTAMYNVRDLIEACESNGMTQTESVEAIANVITQNAAPQTWSANAMEIGARGTLHELAGILIITETPEGHEAVAEVLEQLRSADGERGVNRAIRQSAKPSASAGPHQLFSK
ncbi:MAG TPA: hypothetical protein VG269_12620 [Tepidisphaeraceae bacterium]|jgi:hypothetical protein|nr:hypothetical protein [Tepidisphaeraceae bacterium]